MQKASCSDKIRNSHRSRKILRYNSCKCHTVNVHIKRCYEKDLAINIYTGEIKPLEEYAEYCRAREGVTAAA